MNRRTFCQVLLLIGPAGPVAAGPADKSYTTLRAADTFAVGGVGRGGTTSEGERTLHEILRSKDAVAVLDRLLADPKATPAARLYTLLGLRWKTAPSYEKAAADLLAVRQTAVRTMRGCSIGNEKFAEVAGLIDSGSYDFHRERRDR